MLTEPSAKKSKTTPSEVFDQYQATNYHVKVSDDEKKYAEDVLSKAMEFGNLTNFDVYLKTRILHRLEFEDLPFKEQISRFPWLENVCLIYFSLGAIH